MSDPPAPSSSSLAAKSIVSFVAVAWVWVFEVRRRRPVTGAGGPDGPELGRCITLGRDVDAVDEAGVGVGTGGFGASMLEDGKAYLHLISIFVAPAEATHGGCTTEHFRGVNRK